MISKDLDKIHHHTLSKNIITINDTINKKYHSCGCIIISELDILENSIQEKYLQLCKNHYKKCNAKSFYSYNKKINKYIYNSHNIINYSKSYENLQGIISNNSNNNSNNKEFQTLLSFGKYKDKSYEYVYYNDKLYCYNLAFWNNKEFKNKKILNFITFIKKQLLSEAI
jgi:hypothetical protein